MNLDQLIKLVKLANNNPNDHEANAAARKVCKMIATNNYKLNGTREPSPVGATGATRNAPPPRNPTQGPTWEDRWWDEFARRSRSYENFRQGSWTNEPPKTPPPPFNEEYRWDWNWTGDDKKRDKTVYEQRLRDCSICDKTKLTVDNNNPFVCADCKWRKYEEEKKK